MNEFRMLPVTLFAVAMMAIPINAQVTTMPGAMPPLGESFAGPCFVDDVVLCWYALDEYQSQGMDYGIVATCNECDPEAQAMGVNNQPIYFCFTYGKKEVITEGIIGWVQSVANGQLLWGLEVPATECGTERWCAAICQYNQAQTNLYCPKGPPKPFELNGRYARGISCP